ncbi:hypothetical protein [Candidatus Tokpelaia sp.]|uniref:hypothetical protein n=1 Tax=Candidatus Tokpelaia sp. TaxID=2233777 RepID=UPI00123AB7FF|nr:hypothetical protein [Candidatus Tokpelaia sp.]KAA6404599.1 hypothetical protein DPQ22_08955 [Candidatus Tokpelaia sp.]
MRIRSERLSDIYPDWQAARADLLAQTGTKTGEVYSVTQALKHTGKLATYIFKTAPSLNAYEKAHLNLPEIKIDNRFASIIGTSSEFIAAYALHGYAKCESYFELARTGARGMDKYAALSGLTAHFEADAGADIVSLKSYNKITKDFTLKICRLAMFIAFFRAGTNIFAKKAAALNRHEWVLGRVPDPRYFNLTDDIYEAIRFAVQSIMETYKLVKPEFSLHFCREAFGEIIVTGDGDLYGVDFIGDLKFSLRNKPDRSWLQQLVLYWILKVRTDHFENRPCAIDKISVLNSRTGQLYVMPIALIPNPVIFNAETVFIGIDFHNAIAASFHNRLIEQQ